jgi:release factor glutamine methyltransferase
VTGGLTVHAALAQSGLVPIDAQVLLAHVLGKGRAWLAAHGDDPLPRAEADAFLALARRRRAGEPVGYLTGVREFWGLPLAVTPAVLLPRPETEVVVEIALARLAPGAATRVLDLGTGSGAIALAIARERPQARVLATDVSAAALAVARDNAQRLAIANVEFLESDWYASVPAAWHGGRFDVIASNPPYVVAGDPHLAVGDLRFEPAAALSPGGDGLAALRPIVAGAAARLVPGGALVVEHGHDQADAVRALFAAAGFADVASSRDLAGIPRAVAGRRPPA